MGIQSVWHQQRWLHYKRGTFNKQIHHPLLKCHIFCRCTSYLSGVPAGNDGNNDVHLWHDGQVYLTQRTRRFTLRARGEILSGVLSLWPLHQTCINSDIWILLHLLHVWHFSENGSEQRRSCDYWRIHRNLPKGKPNIKVTGFTTWWLAEFAQLCATTTSSVFFSQQDENIMASMQLFENVI